MDDDHHHLHFRFAWGCSSCLWASGAGRPYAGIALGPIEPEMLPLSGASCAAIAALATRYQGALDWDYPPDPSPWSAAEWAAFERAADRLLIRLRRELGDQFVIDDGRHKEREGGGVIGAGDSAARAVADGLRDWARASDFARAGRRYYRRRGEVVQLIQLRRLGSDGAFLVNVALACDRLRLLAGLPIVERPEEWSCCFRRRLEQLLPDAPEQWPAGTPSEAAATARALVAALDRLRRTLDTITDLERLRGSGWLGERGAELGLRARIAYARGDYHTALDYVEREAAFFAGRRGMRVPDLIARYRLTALAAAQTPR